MAGRWGWAGGQWRMRAGALASTVDTVTPSWLALLVGADGSILGPRAYSRTRMAGASTVLMVGLLALGWIARRRSA